jgi:hypothetical protein
MKLTDALKARIKNALASKKYGNELIASLERQAVMPPFILDFDSLGGLATGQTISTNINLPVRAMITRVWVVSSDITTTGTVNMKITVDGKDVTPDKQVAAEWGSCPNGFDWSSAIGSGFGDRILVESNGLVKLVFSGGTSVNTGNLRLLVEYILID